MMGIYDAMRQDQSTARQDEKPTLLIVDDEPGPRESLRIVFKDRFHCHVATCGQEGIDYARNHPVDAAILDIKMPDLTGVEVLREIKAIDPNIECVMLTGYETIDTARAAVRFGAADYLNKPFDVFSVREVLEKCMARRRGRLAAEQKLRTLQRTNEELANDLAQLNRAVSAGILSAGVVHEMNNPLAIIAGYADLLGRDLSKLEIANHEKTQQVQDRLACIQREIERCKIIARRFLNYSRTEPRNGEVIDAAKLLDDAAALIKAHPANKCAEIDWASCEPELRVRVQPTEIIQVLLNLGVNALHAMKGDGKLKLFAERASAPTGGIAYKAETFDPQKPLIRISVADTGCGIAPEALEKIFQPYFTSKEHGTGLGLAIVCELVSHHNGLVSVESTVGKGTTFTVYLPRAD